MLAALVCLGVAAATPKATTVPGDPMATQCYTLSNGLKVFLSADNCVQCGLGAFSEEVGEGALQRAPAGVAAGAAFLYDNSALCVDLRGLVEHIVGIIGQDHKAAVNHALTLYGDVVEHILGLFKARGSVDVAAEFRAY